MKKFVAITFVLAIASALFYDGLMCGLFALWSVMTELIHECMKGEKE